MYVPVPTQTATPRARELSQRIHETIEEFQHHYPNTRSSDVRDALRIVGGGDRDRRTSVSLIIGLLVAAALGLFVALRVTGGGAPATDQPFPMMIWLVGGLAVLGAIVAVARMRSP